MRYRYAKPRSDEEKKEIYDKWHNLINMSQKALDEWAENDHRLLASINRDEAKEEGGIQSGYDSFHRIKRRKEKKLEDWSAEDFDNASQENGFNSRMLGGKPGDPIGDSGMSKWEISLRNWGHDPSLKSSPQHAKWKTWKKKHTKKSSIERVAMMYGMKKQSCVIAVTHIDGKKCVFKNRDRNYVPDIRVFHIISDNGVEILYFKDERTGWVEGINEHGIVVSNAALMVLEDEKEGTKKKSKAIRFSEDAHRIISALECTTLLQALHILTHLKTGVKGHTMISDERHTFVIEQTSKHEAKVDEVLDEHFVRTNHGIYYSDAGYLAGDDRESSETRYNTMMSVLEGSPKQPEEIIKKLFALRLKDVPNPNNVVRKTENMFTSNQFLFDPKERKMTMYLVDKDSEFVGYEKHFKKPSRCKLEVKRVTSDKSGKVVIEDIEAKEEIVDRPPPNEKVFRVFAYGTLMSDPELPDLITDSWKGHVNSVSRSFNVMSKVNHGHVVLGTRPGGSMQGLVLEYPVASLDKVVKALDKREGYEHGRDNKENTYIRTIMRAYSEDYPHGVLCLIYLTNEESDNYTGEYEHHDLLKELSKDYEDDRVVKYLRTLRNALINETCTDKYITKIREDLIKHHKIRV